MGGTPTALWEPVDGGGEILPVAPGALGLMGEAGLQLWGALSLVEAAQLVPRAGTPVEGRRPTGRAHLPHGQGHGQAPLGERSRWAQGLSPTIQDRGVRGWLHPDHRQRPLGSAAPDPVLAADSRAAQRESWGDGASFPANQCRAPASLPGCTGHFCGTPGPSQHPGSLCPLLSAAGGSRGPPAAWWEPRCHQE